MRTIRRQKRSKSAEDEESVEGGRGQTEFDMSVTTTPEAWLAAQRQSPIAEDPTPLSRQRGMTLVPKGRRASVFNVLISALIGSLLTGTVWYWLDGSGFYDGPWIAVAAGMFIAVVVRAFSGGVDSTLQGALAAGVYFLTLAAALLLIARRNLTEIYGPIRDFQLYEENLVETRFQDPVQVLAFLLGALAAIIVTYLLRER